MISQFTISTSRTINLGNFESLRIEASVTFDVDPGAHWADAKPEAEKALRDLMEETYRAQTPKKQTEKA